MYTQKTEDMQITEIHTTDITTFSFMEKVLTESFPPNEYRDLKDLRHYSDHNTLFHASIIHEKEKLVGLINYWDFANFCYIEHFAIENSMRSRGYGAFSLFLLKKIINKPIILEVELPLKEQAIKRIKFYRRQGFELWNNYYEQPPYRSNEKSYPMLLMAYGDIDKAEQFKHIRNTIYKEVYGITN